MRGSRMIRLSSPRLRRRLAWCAALVSVAGGIALVFVLLPQPKQPSLGATGKPGSAVVAQPVSTRVQPADRRAIDKVLDRFIPDGIGRRSMATAWRLAGPEMKATTTLGQWRHDVSPLQYFPVAGTTFHDWTTLDAGRNYVDLSVSVRSRRGSHRGSWTLTGEMIRHGSHWLVNSLYPSATYTDFGSPAGPDVQAEGSDAAVPGRPRLGRGWLIGSVYAIAIVLASVPLVLLLVFLLDRLRRRRRPAQPLPPLPSSVAFAPSPERGSGVTGHSA